MNRCAGNAGAIEALLILPQANGYCVEAMAEVIAAKCSASEGRSPAMIPHIHLFAMSFARAKA